MIRFAFRVKNVCSEQDEQTINSIAHAVFDNILQIEWLASESTLTLLFEQGVVMEQESMAAFIEQMKAAGYNMEPCLNGTNANASEKIKQLSTSSPKARIKIPLSAFIACVCAVLILSILATYTFTSHAFQQQILLLQQQLTEQLPPDDEGSTDDGGKQDEDVFSSYFPELDLIHELYSFYSVFELDREAMVEAVLDAYAEQSGDEYACYYTQEELEQLRADNIGEMEGIGVSIVETTVTYTGVDYAVMQVISVYEDSPALKAGVHVGDMIFSVFDEEGTEHLIQEIDYDNAINMIKGPSGTHAKFIVLRPGTDQQYEKVTFTAERAKVQAKSVMGRVLESNPTIGVIKISQFDLTTPVQFEQAMETLIRNGCKKFVFDVRYNPGGDLESIRGVLSYFLQEGNPMIYTVTRSGAKSVDVVEPIVHEEDIYRDCDVSREDIGKYRGYEFAVLMNQYTASAAELFASNMRDYDLAILIGEKTFGKGCMQSTFNLEYFGVEGGFKLTTAWYLPPSEVGYHGIGISPTEGYEIAFDQTVLDKYGNVYLIPDEEDNQLAAAIAALQ